jgi:hypothetical protein
MMCHDSAEEELEGHGWGLAFYRPLALPSGINHGSTRRRP